MNFDFSDEQKQLKETARRFLDDRCTPAEVRKILDGDAPYHAELWQGLAEMGFMGTAIPEQYGGLGAGYLELCVIAEELGRANAPVPFSSTVYLAAEFLMQAGSEEQKQKHLPRIAAGELIATYAAAERSGRVSPKNIETTFSDGKVTGRKIIVPDGDVADVAIVAVRTGSGDDARSVSLCLVDLGGKGVTRTVVDTLDPTRSHADIEFSGTPGELLGREGQGWDVAERVLDRAAIMIAFEQIGGADRALEMGRDYAMERLAFGRPIGSFQAIKHMLADMYVSATLARSNSYYGAWALSTNAGELPEAAATSRVSATKAFQHCAKNNIQVHGGMGFTWEFDCHLYYRRSNLLAVSLGSLSEWEDKLIDRMQTRNAPEAA